MQHAACRQIDDLGAALAMQAECDAIAGTACGKVHAAPLTSSGTRCGQYGGIAETSAVEGSFQLSGFADEVFGVIQGVERAAAAGAEVRAGRPEP
jgi:hypothetical protein